MKQQSKALVCRVPGFGHEIRPWTGCCWSLGWLASLELTCLSIPVFLFFLSLIGCVYTAGWCLERSLLRSATSSFHFLPSLSPSQALHSVLLHYLGKTIMSTRHPYCGMSTTLQHVGILTNGRCVFCTRSIRSTLHLVKLTSNVENKVVSRSLSVKRECSHA